MNMSFYNAAVGACQQQLRMNVQAHNIANVNTQGYRADGVDERMNLYNMNRKLKGFFGPRYGLTIRSIGDGLEGTEVCVRLPLGAAEALQERAM